MTKQEKRFEYKGFPCVIMFQSLGFRCGYVGFSEDTKVDLEDLRCHGGITYVGTELRYQNDTNKVWIGFDCGHCFDGYDVEKIEEYFGDDAGIMKQLRCMKSYYEKMNEECEIRTLEYCEEECKKMVDQYLEMTKLTEF